MFQMILETQNDIKIKTMSNLSNQNAKFDENMTKCNKKFDEIMMIDISVPI